MSIFSRIIEKIFPSNHPAVNSAPDASAGGVSSPGGTGATPGASTSQAQANSGTPMPAVDVEAVLNAKAEKNPQKLNWRTSIVDLMKLLDLDSSLGARKELAGELGYTGDTSDSASMNIWLHKQVMQKLAQNGDKVPADLRA